MCILEEVEKIENICRQDIIDLLNNYDFTECYKYDKFKLDSSPFNDEDLQKISKAKTSFEKNILLKEILDKKLKNANDDDKKQIFNWFVSEWGGIRNVDLNIAEINTSLNDLKNGKMSAKQFDTISSFSKIASLYDNEKYFILDSRVTFSLNWILLKNKSRFYFPILPGRNSRLVKYNMSGVLSLYFKNEDIYYDKQFAYFIYCKLIENIFKKCNKEKIKKPYYIEMMLFSMLDKTIDEIKAKVKITIE
jgi:hypothetical protein